MKFNVEVFRTYSKKESDYRKASAYTLFLYVFNSEIEIEHGEKKVLVYGLHIFKLKSEM